VAGAAGAGTLGASGSDGIAARALAALRVCHDLSKFKLSAFVTTTAAAGYVLASPENIDWEQLGWTSLGTMLCSSSANTFNQVFEAGAYTRPLFSST
jgi:protoheme IX farnesyltransferase